MKSLALLCLLLAAQAPARAQQYLIRDVPGVQVESDRIFPWPDPNHPVPPPDTLRRDTVHYACRLLVVIGDEVKVIKGWQALVRADLRIHDLVYPKDPNKTFPDGSITMLGWDHTPRPTTYLRSVVLAEWYSLTPGKRLPPDIEVVKQLRP